MLSNFLLTAFSDEAGPDFQVKVEKDILTISAKMEKTEESKDEKWTRKEFSFTSFERSFKLPEVVNSEAIGARYENGLLTLSLPI